MFIIVNYIKINFKKVELIYIQYNLYTCYIFLKKIYY